MTLNCIIIDDEPLALDLLESYVLKTPFLHLEGKYLSALQAMKEMTDKQIDLIFLDIQMPGLNGIEFSRMVKPETRIIFITAFNQYALDSYRVNALDYLLKPVSYTDFVEAVNKALQWFELARKSGQPASTNAETKVMDSIYVKSDYKLVQVKLKDILYIEGLKDYIKIYMENESKAILSLMSMKAIEELLPNGSFIRIHRSYIVQKEKIKIVERGRIVFGKNYLPVSDSYKKEFQAFLDERMR